MKRLLSLSKDEFKKFIDSIDVVLSDCDDLKLRTNSTSTLIINYLSDEQSIHVLGVLWRETDAIPGSPETVNALKEMKKKFFYITNNNTKTRPEFVGKCQELKYTASVDEIVCTSFLAAVYLKQKNIQKKVYIVGSAAIAKELEAQNIKHIGVGPDTMDGDELDMLKNFQPDPEVGAVIVGFDKHFSYPKLVKAATYLQDPDIHFVGTNSDTIRPSPNSNKFPGTGCFIRTIEAASGRSAVMVGKPESFLSEYIIKQYSLNPERTLMIGDNPTTDILLGKRCGFKTLLVLSGVTSQLDVEAMGAGGSQGEDQLIPDYYTDKLSDVLDMLKTI